MTLFRALSLLAPLAAAGCLGSPDAGSAVRFGAAVGRTFGAGRNDVDAEGPALANVAAELSEAWSTSGFLELVVPDESFDLHLRTIRAESLHAVEEIGGEAQLRQLLVTGAISRAVVDLDWLRLSPLFGLGTGWTELDFRGAFAPSDQRGLAAAVIGGLEAEIGGHVLVGAMAWAQLFGYPGETEGEAEAVMLYGGVRF
ncbi:MAG: hypothetical protein KDE27_31570 [Planctomycetes bacterium]|nr:hypothetical protein [Planctomycetota bacterium]